MKVSWEKGMTEYVENGNIQDGRMCRHLRGRACVDFECNPPSFLATVFRSCSLFNADISNWDVAKVTTMHASKS
jgi:surface protein